MQVDGTARILMHSETYAISDKVKGRSLRLSPRVENGGGSYQTTMPRLYKYGGITTNEQRRKTSPRPVR